MDINTLLRHKKFIPDKLLSYGFVCFEDSFVYQTNLLEGQFSVRVCLRKDESASCELIDTTFEEPYTLHLAPHANGVFIARVKDAYEAILMDIVEACFESDVFKNEAVKQVIAYIREQYEDELEFLWARLPNNAIYRRKDTGKWYAAILTVSNRRLGIDAEGDSEVIDLRANPEEIPALLSHDHYLPAYHMNKKHWFTLYLEGDIPFDEIKKRIDDSYRLATK